MLKNPLVSGLPAKYKGVLNDENTELSFLVEYFEGSFGTVDNWLASHLEGCVNEDSPAGFLFDFEEKCMKPGVIFFRYDLRPRRAVEMKYRRQRLLGLGRRARRPGRGSHDRAYRSRNHRPVRAICCRPLAPR